MLDFSKLKLNNTSPLFIQLALYVKSAIISGAAKDGEVLPSRRELAACLGINPNTVQKAYQLMEEEGVIVTPPKAASVIRVTDEMLADIQEELEDSFVRHFVRQAQKNGLGYKRVIELISQYWEEDV